MTASSAPKLLNGPLPYLLRLYDVEKQCHDEVEPIYAVRAPLLVVSSSNRAKPEDWDSYELV